VRGTPSTSFDIEQSGPKMQINKLLLLIAGIAGVAFAVPDTEVTVTTHPIKPDPPRGCPAEYV
ncbi:hypothetical protein PoMZ_00256, partial [Pyricularia oryzae]